MRLIIVLLGLVTSTLAQICCPPKQFEGLMGELGGTCPKQGQPYIFTVGGNIHYDFKKAMLVIEEVVNVGPQIKVQIIQDYGNHMMYTIVMDNCTKAELIGSIDEAVCIPDTAQHTGTYIYGLDTPMVGEAYTYLMGENMSIMSIVTSKQCMPLSQTMVLDQPDGETIVNVGYVNVTLGIKDPSVFDIPKICQQNDVIIPFKAMDDLVSDRMKKMVFSFGAR